MDTDSDQRYIKSGDSLENRNILVGEDESNGVITQMLGNSRTVDISDHVLNLSHTYKVIGSYYNRLTRKVYYFIFSQPYEIPLEGTTTTTSTTTYAPWDFDIDYTYGSFQYDNRLLCYNEDTQTLDVIFIDRKNYFGLDMDYPMRDISMIGDWLYFNPRISEPKVIDVTMAYNYTNYDKYDSTLPYAYGEYVTYFGGLFRANQTVAIGETPCNTVSHWTRVGDSYQDESSIAFIDSEFRYAFNVIKSPPRDRITHSFRTDTTINSNNVRGKMVRFTHRYEYFDKSYSVFSAYSDITLPIEDENYDGEFIDDLRTNNFIRLDFTLHSSALIRSVEIFFQEIGESWRRCKTVNRREQGLLDNTENFTYDFYNNEAYEVYADPTSILKIQDAVPPLANSQEIINKNILCYGGVTEGFDNIPKENIDVTLIPVIETMDVPLSVNTLLRDSEESDIQWHYHSGYYETNITIGNWYPGVDLTGAYYTFRIFIQATGQMYEGTIQLTGAMLVSALTLATAIKDAIIAQGYGNVFVVLPVDTPWWGYTIQIRDFTMKFPVIFKSQFYIAGAEVTALTKKRGFKTGAFHPFCLFYYDDSLRRWDAQTSKFSEDASDAFMDFSYNGTTVYVPMFNELSPVPNDTARRWTIDWEVGHLPPAGAKYWRWGYAGNGLCQEFVQYIIGTNGIVQGALAGEQNMLQIDITPLQTLKDTAETNWNQFPQSNISSYSWQKGDRIRFITQTPIDISAPGTKFGELIDGVYDFEIIKEGVADSNLIYIQYFPEYNVAGVNIGENSLVEIYTPVKRTERLEYYEFGELMPVVEDSAGVMVHSGKDSLHNQDSITGAHAMGTFDGGDVYHILRTPSKPLCTNAAYYTQGAFHESMWYSDFYKSDEWDKGKIGIETIFNKRKLNIIRYSRPYFQNTEINGLPTFDTDPDNGWPGYKELNDIFGEIIAIYEVGDTLKVYMERKSASILIGRTEYSGADGAVTVAISTATLGAIRYSESNYSTIFPESISRNNKYIYLFDIYNGVMCRDGVNGIFPISGRYAEAGGSVDYKMATYFKDKAKALMVSGVDHIDVLSVWDEEFKLLYVIFKDYVLEDNNEVVVFHEPTNRWICYCDLAQTPSGGYNVPLELTYDIVKGFEGGLNYLFDEDTRFTIFNFITTSNIQLEPLNMDLVLTVYPPTSVVIVSAPIATDESAVEETSFTANWEASENATGYYIDVSLASDFSSFVAGYNNLDVGNVITKNVVGLIADTTYYYRVRAYSTSGATNSSNVISTRTSTPPATPIAIDATDIDFFSFTANWNASVGATGYYLDVSIDIAFGSFLTGYNNRDVGNVLSWGIRSLSSFTTYYYRIRAYNAKGQITISSNIITTTTPLEAPVATMASSIKSTSFTANWSSSVSALGYYIDVATDSGFISMVVGYNNLNVGNIITKSITGLTVDTTYYYRLRAYNGATISLSSNTISARTSDEPEAPIALPATNISSTRFTCNWIEPIGIGGGGYCLDVSTDITFATFIVGYNNRDVGDVLSWPARGLSSGTTYYYRVRAYNAKGQFSEYSNIITVTTL
jgi:hypothetical protein